MGVPFVIVNQALPSRFLRIIGSGRWDTLYDDTVLILRFARISEKFRLQMGDIAIKLLELHRKRIRLGLIVGFVVIKNRRWRGGSICRARRKCEI
jgi:hypothetical protein